MFSKFFKKPTETPKENAKFNTLLAFNVQDSGAIEIVFDFKSGNPSLLADLVFVLTSGHLTNVIIEKLGGMAETQGEAQKFVDVFLPRLTSLYKSEDEAMQRLVNDATAINDDDVGNQEEPIIRPSDVFSMKGKNSNDEL